MTFHCPPENSGTRQYPYYRRELTDSADIRAEVIRKPHTLGPSVAVVTCGGYILERRLYDEHNYTFYTVPNGQSHFIDC